MNREIKFRAWDGERMRQVNTLGFTDDAFVSTSKGSGPIEDYKVMQYTGLKDKNGVDIYEGDVIESIENGYIYSIDRISPLSRNEGIEYSSPIGVRESDGSIMTSNGIRENYSDDWISNPEFYEVIGNIYENPELIK